MEVSATDSPRLSSRERALVWAATVAIAATRVWACAKTLWDWDEVQFALALREYDVAWHQPHPPGFPMFLAMAEVLRTVIPSDFRSLQILTLIAAAALFPLAFALARELSFPFASAFAGALLFVFFPNVWFYGGTAFSDVAGLAVTLAALVLLLRGRRNRRDYLLGALALGVAAAIRPQALLIGCVPAVVATVRRVRTSWIDLPLATALGAAVIIASHAGAAAASSSVAEYIGTVRAHQDYISKIDSYLSPHRESLPLLFDDFFISSIPGGRLAVITALLAAAGLVAGAMRRRQVWILLGAFLPFCLFGWLMLDVNSISRYAVMYGPLHALLAAEGIAAIALVQRRFARGITLALAAALAIAFASWATAGIDEARKTVSPPVAAMEWLRAHVAPHSNVYVHGSMGPFAKYYLPEYERVSFESPATLPLAPAGPRDYVVIEGGTSAAHAQKFVRNRRRLFDMVRRRYFEVSVVPVTEMAEFGEGWYGEEGEGENFWRWMGARSITFLPPIAGDASLELEVVVPFELVPRRPVVDVTLNGSLVGKILCTKPSMSAAWRVPARADGRNELTLSISRVLNPVAEGLSGDARDLGLQLVRYGWMPAGAAR